MMATIMILIGDLLTWIVPAFVIYVMIKTLPIITTESRERAVKLFICMGVTLLIIYCHYQLGMLGVYSVATLVNNLGIDETLNDTAIDLYVNIFLFLYELMIVVVINNVWKLYFKQIIPGTGSIKHRLYCIYTRYKIFFKKAGNKNEEIKKINQP